MKALQSIALLLFSLNVYALNPSLAPIIAKVQVCEQETLTLLCDDSILEDLKTVSMDARGEFVYFLKDKMIKNETPVVIENLYQELQKLVVVYEELDSCSEWSCRDAKGFLGDVSIRYVKIAPINTDFLIKLYRDQRAQSGRYGLLMTLQSRAQAIELMSEMDSLVAFAEFAKDHSRTIGDEHYLYQAAVELIKKMTEKMVALSPAHEGLFAIEFDDATIESQIRMDRIAVMESNYRDGLVVNFSYSKSNIVRFSFKSSGILGSQIYSSDDAYNDRLDFSAPYFKFKLDKTTGDISGFFSSARFGKATFTGRRLMGVQSVYRTENVQGLELKSLLGRTKVKVGNYEMTLVLRTRADDKTLVEGSLVNENALISFSKVRLDSKKGVLHLVDSKNERKLTLAINAVDGAGLMVSGLMINAAQGTFLTVESL